ncbi:hypothetical protein ACT3R4_17735 [Halomonas sp. AOP7-E1-9]
MQGILNVVSLLVLAVISLLPFVAKHWVKAWFSKDLEILKSSVQKDLVGLQHLNSISQPALAKVFSKKIEVYTELSKIKNEFTRYRNESHEPEVSDDFESVTGRFHGYFERCRKVIEMNKLYVSSGLSKKYDTWYRAAYPYYQESEIDGYEVYSSSWGKAEDVENAHFASLAALSTMIEKTMPQMEDIFSQVEKDIAEIREYVDLAIKVTS